MFSFTKRQWRNIGQVLVISSLIGALVGLLLFQDPDVPPLQRLLSGALVGLLVASLLIALREVISHSRLVQMRFGWFTVVNLALNAVVIYIAVQLAALPFTGGAAGGLEVFGVSVLIATALTAWFAIDRLLGTGVLFSLLTGSYHHPRHEERVFLFADLADSTALAENLGDLRYHSFLNRLFTEIAPPIDRHGGTVHRYVGDEIIVTWTAPEGTQDASCLLCALAILDKVAEAAPGFQKDFGSEPRLRTALHAGEVVAGEISGQKREIVFSGDTVNTTARISAIASETDQNLVMSHELLQRLDVTDGVEIDSLGSFHLKGRAAPIELFAVVR